MLLHEPQSGRKPPLAQPVVLRNRDLRLKPDFRLACFVMNVNMHSRFFSREEVEPIPPRPKNRRTHRVIVLYSPMSVPASSGCAT